MATRKEYDGADEVTSIASGDLIKIKQASGGAVKKITEENLSAKIQDDLFDNTPDTAIASTDKIVKEASDGTKKTVTKAILSAQVQDDLFDNTVVTEATVVTDKIVIEKADGTKKTITPQILMQQMKGYKEYTFAIRQSGTDAPTISVIKDDFGLETPLVATRSSAGSYGVNVSTIGTNISNTKINISNNRRGYYAGSWKFWNVASYLSFDGVSGNITSLNIQTDKDGTLSDTVMEEILGCVISIRETLT